MTLARQQPASHGSRRTRAPAGPAAGTATIDPPLIVPSGSTLFLGMTGYYGSPIKVGLRGYVVYPGEI